jgi:RimJ/RimL family protein N-acetyltransferase
MLRDGSVVPVRPLEPADRAALAAAAARLSSRTLYLRFASPKPSLSTRDLDSLMDVDHHRREALLAIDPRTRAGVAVARYAELPDEPGAVDVAVTIADAWQGRGLGTALMQRLLARAREEGHVVARASVLSDNAPSLAMLRRAGFRPRGWDGAMRELELPLHTQQGV